MVKTNKQMTEREEEYGSDFLGFHQFNKSKLKKRDGQFPQKEHVQIILPKERNIENNSGYLDRSAKLPKLQSRPLCFENTSQKLRITLNSEDDSFGRPRDNQYKHDNPQMKSTEGNSVTPASKIHQRSLANKVVEIFRDVYRDCLFPYYFSFTVLVVAGIFYYLILYDNLERPFDSKTSQVGKTERPFDSKASQVGKTDSLHVPERRIIIVGLTGSGKSATGNTILGFESFPAKPVGQSDTGQIKLGIAERFQRKLVVIDTPGLFDTDDKKTNTDVLREISKCYAVISPGIHAIILVIPIGRITDGIDRTVDIILKYFGHDASSVMIVVFTFKLLLEFEEVSLDTYIKAIPSDSPVSQVLRQVDGRYIAFGYKGEKIYRDEEVKQLLDMIDTNIEKFPDGWYPHEMFRRIEQYLSDEDEKMASKYWSINDKEAIRDNLRNLIVRYIKGVFGPYFQYFSKLYASYESKFSE